MCLTLADTMTSVIMSQGEWVELEFTYLPCLLIIDDIMMTHHQCIIDHIIIRGYASESDGEEMAGEGDVTLPQDLPGRGNIRSEQSAVKLSEVRAGVVCGVVAKHKSCISFFLLFVLFSVGTSSLSISGEN